MKYYLLTIIVFITIIGLSSCKKTANPTNTTIIDTIVKYDTIPSSTPSPYYIRATVNGVNAAYTNYTAAIKNDYELQVYGFNSDAINTADGIHLIFLYSQPNPPIGFYPDTTATTSVGDGHIYLQQLGVYYVDYQSFSTTITAINDSTVSGTFSGIVYYTAGSPSATITNGSFYVPF